MKFRGIVVTSSTHRKRTHSLIHSRTHCQTLAHNKLGSRQWTRWIDCGLPFFKRDTKINEILIHWPTSCTYAYKNKRVYIYMLGPRIGRAHSYIFTVTITITTRARARATCMCVRYIDSQTLDRYRQKRQQQPSKNIIVKESKQNLLACACMCVYVRRKWAQPKYKMSSAHTVIHCN